ncbi:MAG TPA: Cof-type HAD-IIB family hydrolase, partial [Lachnospiraceae bacterium]|nr:Cof-type HAD-IIB family hydrolase [Lachnospiraceae bacterium]
MADIKIIVMDMDGTLLNSDKIVSNYTKQLLKKLNSEGYKLGIASGRPIVGLKRTVAALGIESCINFMTGS